LDPKVLAIPAALADLLLPNAFGYVPGIYFLLLGRLISFVLEKF